MIACFQHNLLLLSIKHFLHKIIQTEQHTLSKAEVLKGARDFVTVLQRKQRNLGGREPKKPVFLANSTLSSFWSPKRDWRAFDSALSSEFNGTSIQTLYEEPVVKRHTYTNSRTNTDLQVQKRSSQPAHNKQMTKTSKCIREHAHVFLISKINFPATPLRN